MPALFALPAELREQIYSYVLQGRGRRQNRQSFRQIQYPALACVSRLTRKELLSLFYAQTKFTATVGTDLDVCSTQISAPRSPPHRSAEESSKIAGCLTRTLSDHTQAMIRAAGDAARFRHVIILVCLTENLELALESRQMRREANVGSNLLFGEIEAGFQDGRLFWKGRQNPFGWLARSRPFSSRDVDDAFGDVVRFAQSVVEKETFGSGFTFADLEEIALGLK